MDHVAELRQAIQDVFAIPTDIDHAFIVQRFLPGKEFRMVLLDGEMLLCYEKRYMSLVGDGVSTVKQLITSKNEEFKRKGDKIKTIAVEENKLLRVLAREDLTLDSKLPLSRELVLNDVLANLDSGATAVDLTAAVGEDYNSSHKYSRAKECFANVGSFGLPIFLIG